MATNTQNAALINWKDEAAKAQLPVFPIRIKWNGKKWDKIPLCRNGVLDANYNVDKNDWTHANGYGIAMGEKSQLYAMDIDSYKEGCEADAWLDKFKVPRETRTHETISGGRHLIFALSNKYKTLPSRANIVQGLDSRGQGGFIAFGEGYKMLDERFPTILPQAACEEILETYGGTGGPIVVKNYIAPDNIEQLEKKLKRVLHFGPRKLHMRWNNDRRGLTDQSGSAMDHSVAKLLTYAGFTETEVVWALLNKFEHGSARAKGDVRVALRAAGRSAAKGQITTEEERDMSTRWKEPPMPTEADEELIRKALGIT